jgi:hypothetical protein
MKTNLDRKYKMDTSLEQNGVWVVVAEDVEFLIKRFGGFNSQKVRAAMAEYLKPYAKKIENGTLSPEKEHEVGVRVFVESCVADWKGVKEEKDGSLVEIPFSNDNAIKLFCDLPELFSTLVTEAQNSENYKEVLGNS